ncbi:MAG TPA: hypothetical protein VIV06_07275, partial [Candidatus Limnocylindrales bacterium]
MSRGAAAQSVHDTRQASPDPVRLPGRASTADDHRTMPFLAVLGRDLDGEARAPGSPLVEAATASL